MRIEIGQFEYTECWDGVLYKKLSDYPNITEWEIQNILDFIKYESDNGRSCEIGAEESIICAIEGYRTNKTEDRLLPPGKITECTACPKYKGCMTDLVCHTSSLKDAISILNCGSLLSAVLARKKSAKELKAESRNAANVVVPSEYRIEIEPYIPDPLSEKVHFVERGGSDIWKWSEIAYEYCLYTMKLER